MGHRDRALTVGREIDEQHDSADGKGDAIGLAQPLTVPARHAAEGDGARAVRDHER